MSTIGKHWPSSRPRGDFATRCSYCGVVYPRSKLVKDASGNLACTCSSGGRDLTTLAKLNAARAAERQQLRPIGDGPAGFTQQGPYVGTTAEERLAALK
jgi:hypothetical protein